MTAEQQAAAEAAEASVAVVAGAGTGKTRVLTERYIHLVLEKKVEIGRILAVTFTEKAAREMKDRIRAALPPGLARQAEFAPISTIHAFLARQLRERALDAGVDPRFVIADELTTGLLLDDALKETIDAMEVGELVQLGRGEEYLRELYLAARATPLRWHELRIEEPDLDDLRARAGRFLDACAGERATAPGTRDKLVALKGLAPRLRAMDLHAGDEFWDAVKGNVAAGQRELFRDGKELAREWQALAYLELSREVAARVVEALRALDERYAAKKRAEGLLDFADLEHFGLALLDRVDLGLDYDHLLVDEYQDTSRIQQAILDKLAAHCARFGVGDAKQSIYRFRYADAGVFRELQDDAETYPLCGSFRAREEVVEFNNELFGTLFAGGGVEAQDLRAEAQWRPKSTPSVELITFEAPRAIASRRQEARALARRLSDLVRNERLRITDARQPDRPLGYGDCAILLRAMTNLPVYERALVEAAVPYVVTLGRGYYAAREVVELAFLLSLLGDPYDRYRAVGVMTSLLCGVPEADLLQLPEKTALPLAALHMERPEAIPPERWDKLVAFGRRFERWRLLAGRVGTGELIETILAQTCFAELLLLGRDGRRRHANLMKALRRARQAHTDPDTYARELLEFRERGMRESEAPIAAETDNAVKIMTVHAAKGLEFPLVAVADSTGRVEGRKGAVLRPDGVFGFTLREGDAPGMRALRAWDREQERDEQLRLNYVAFTRAREHLILSGGQYRSCNRTVLDPLLTSPPPQLCLIEADRSRNGRRRGGAVVRGALRRAAPMPASLERDEAGARELIERIEAIRPRALDATPYVAAVADLVEFCRCPRRYRLGRMLGIEIEELEGREAPGAEEHPRREQGTAFHEVLAAIGPGGIPDEPTVRRHWPDARDSDVERIIAWSRWLAGQEIARKLDGLKQHREMPFFARIAGLPVRGVIDLYAPAVPLLLDYKTSRQVREGEYAVQVAVYLAALRELGFAAPKTAQLVYVDAQEVVEVDEQPLEKLIGDFTSAHRGDGDFPPEPGEACTYCDFRNACVRNGVDCP